MLRFFKPLFVDKKRNMAYSSYPLVMAKTEERLKEHEKAIRHYLFVVFKNFLTGRSTLMARQLLKESVCMWLIFRSTLTQTYRHPEI